MQHLPEHPTLTVENWETWEREDGLYVVYSDGMVQSVLDDKFLNRQFHEVEKQFTNVDSDIFVDNCINPHFVKAAADEMGFAIDPISWEVIIGRWEKINYDSI